jgi:hypothetical protein
MPLDSMTEPKREPLGEKGVIRLRALFERTILNFPMCVQTHSWETSRRTSDFGLMPELIRSEKLCAIKNDRPGRFGVW